MEPDNYTKRMRAMAIGFCAVGAVVGGIALANHSWRKDLETKLNGVELKLDKGENQRQIKINGEIYELRYNPKNNSVGIYKIETSENQ